jgi:hypothetical protein
MKRALWIPIVALAVLAMFLCFRGERAPDETPSAPIAPTHGTSDVPELSTAPWTETSPSRVDTPPVAATRDRVPPSSATDPGAPPPLVDLSTAAAGLSTAASTTVVTALTDDERAILVRKYASSSRDARRAAREKLESFVLAQKTGTLEKSRVVSEEEIRAMRQEIAWLADNPRP